MEMRRVTIVLLALALCAGAPYSPDAGDAESPLGAHDHHAARDGEAHHHGDTDDHHESPDSPCHHQEQHCCCPSAAVTLALQEPPACVEPAFGAGIRSISTHPPVPVSLRQVFHIPIA